MYVLGYLKMLKAKLSAVAALPINFATATIVALTVAK